MGTAREMQDGLSYRNRHYR